MVINAPWYVRNTTIHKYMKIPFVIQTLHTTYSKTLISVTFHNTCHPTDNIDAARTSSHYTRRETVTGHRPPTYVRDDCKYVKL
jgi:hypothetical protein